MYNLIKTSIAITSLGEERANHEGNISKMPNFDAFSLLDIKKRNKRSQGKRKNGNFFFISFWFKYSLKFWTSSNAF